MNGGPPDARRGAELNTAPGGVTLQNAGSATASRDIATTNGVATLPSDLTISGTGSVTLAAVAPFAGLTSANSNAEMASSRANRKLIDPPWRVTTSKAVNRRVAHTNYCVRSIVLSSYSKNVPVVDARRYLQLWGFPGAGTPYEQEELSPHPCARQRRLVDESTCQARP